jgi:hypothetical protein
MNRKSPEGNIANPDTYHSFSKTYSTDESQNFLFTIKISSEVNFAEREGNKMAVNTNLMRLLLGNSWRRILAE